KELTASDWGFVLEKGGQLSTAMDNLMGDVLESLRKGYVRESGEKVSLKRDFSIPDMIQCIETNPSILELYQPASRTAMIQRLRRADRLGVFHPGGTSAQDLAVAGQITIIDVAPLGSDAHTVLAILTNMLCRQVLTYRMAWTDEGESAREELPPTWLIIDEAHTLVPKTGSTPAKEAIVGYAKLGRRFGCSLVLCTQQPSAVSDDAISQADIILSHSLSHDNDIKALMQRAPAVMPDKFRDKVFISSLPRGVGIVFDQSTENKRGFMIQVRPRVSQHGGTDRLSALFEAARLMIPDEIELEDVEIMGAAAPELMDEGIAEELPDVPRPSLKLSKEDWEIMDAWMKEYVEAYFDSQKQEYAITEEIAPRAEDDAAKPLLEWDLTDTEVPEEYTPAEIDGSVVSIRRFGPIQVSLLEKAIARKVLYSPVTHGYLFGRDSFARETTSIVRSDIEPHLLVVEVVSRMGGMGLQVDSIEDSDGFSFVLLRKNGTRAGLSVGASGSMTCVAVTVVGDNRKEVASISNQLNEIGEK
ncbi:MAG: ATP-binding protein, partial [Candidatus Thorarchaeota archaeon]